MSFKYPLLSAHLASNPVCHDPLLILWFYTNHLLTNLQNVQWSAANIQPWCSQNVTHQVALWGCR